MYTASTRRWSVLATALVCQLSAAQVAEVAAPARTEFLIAYEIARTGFELAGEDSETLRSYPLYPYLQAMRLEAALDAAVSEWTAADDAVRAFLDDHAGEPVTVNLRQSWLKSLAARELWPAVIEHYRESAADTALTCRMLAARTRLDPDADTDAELAAQILAIWLTPYQLPTECETAFQWLRDRGELDAGQTAARVRLLLAEGQPAFARVIARRLPESEAAPLLTWADLIDDPRTALEDVIARSDFVPEPSALLDGWSRLARDEPDTALLLYGDLSARVGSELASELSLALALGLAWDRRPESLEYFARVADADMDDYALGWLARSALWNARLPLAATAIARMSAAERDTSTWRYWLGRVSEDPDVRATLFESLQARDNYYSAAAAAQSHDRPELHPEKHAPDPPMLARLAAVPAIVRARELRLIDLPVAAAREWQFAAAGFSRAERLQSVHLAMELEWFELAVATATDGELFYDYELLYPRPYREAVAAAAREFDVAESLIFAVMRQESLYRRDAESGAGAYGLMQLTRGTAADVARAIGSPVPGYRELLDPAINIRLGTARLSELLARYDDAVVPALAAYNAGPAATDRWLPDAAVDGDIWLENIPYNETRDYVRRVLWHSVVFASLDGRRVQARDWLEPVRAPD